MDIDTTSTSASPPTVSQPFADYTVKELRECIRFSRLMKHAHLPQMYKWSREQLHGFLKNRLGQVRLPERPLTRKITVRLDGVDSSNQRRPIVAMHASPDHSGRLYFQNEHGLYSIDKIMAPLVKEGLQQPVHDAKVVWHKASPPPRVIADVFGEGFNGIARYHSNGFAVARGSSYTDITWCTHQDGPSRLSLMDNKEGGSVQRLDVKVWPTRSQVQQAFLNMPLPAAEEIVSQLPKMCSASVQAIAKYPLSSDFLLVCQLPPMDFADATSILLHYSERGKTMCIVPIHLWARGDIGALEDAIVSRAGRVLVTDCARHRVYSFQFAPNTAEIKEWIVFGDTRKGGVAGHADGQHMVAQFSGPRGIVEDPNIGNTFYIADSQNKALRRLKGRSSVRNPAHTIWTVATVRDVFGNAPQLECLPDCLAAISDAVLTGGGCLLVNTQIGTQDTDVLRITNIFPGGLELAVWIELLTYGQLSVESNLSCIVASYCLDTSEVEELALIKRDRLVAMAGFCRPHYRLHLALQQMWTRQEAAFFDQRYRDCESHQWKGRRTAATKYTYDKPVAMDTNDVPSSTIAATPTEWLLKENSRQYPSKFAVSQPANTESRQTAIQLYHDHLQKAMLASALESVEWKSWDDVTRHRFVTEQWNTLTKDEQRPWINRANASNEDMEDLEEQLRFERATAIDRYGSAFWHNLER